MSRIAMLTKRAIDDVVAVLTDVYEHKPGMSELSLNDIKALIVRAVRNRMGYHIPFDMSTHDVDIQYIDESKRMVVMFSKRTEDMFCVAEHRLREDDNTRRLANEWIDDVPF